MTNFTKKNLLPLPTHAVILAGGSGTRLWPVSREALPKQFISLFSDRTLLEETVARQAPTLYPKDVTIVTSAAAAKGEPMVHLAPYHQLLEPVARNTAPAIGIAALALKLRLQDAVMVVLPADHMINNVEGYQHCLRRAIDLAHAGNLVTFGIVPTRPETGYGYIRCNQPGAAHLAVAQFKEKPDLATAQAFIAEGNYYWNSGMFVWRASVILDAIETHLPAVHAMLAHVEAAVHAGMDFQQAVTVHFAEAPSVSIDHGVLEKVTAANTARAEPLEASHPTVHAEPVEAQSNSSPRLLLVPADIGWNDIGSWDAVYELKPKDEAGNSMSGNALAHSVRNVQIHAGKRLVAAVGVEDISIIDTPDAVLVTGRGASQDVRHVAAALVQRPGAREHIEHLTVYRPWGSYTVLEDHPTHKVKRIVVNPGGRLSLQSHEHRAEHWVVVSGIATVTNGPAVCDLKPNESTYIPVGEKHRLENKGNVPVELIEVQVGAYLGEDDIKRYDDQYGRT